MAFSDPTHSILAHIQRYDQWIKAGFSGAMEYLVRGQEKKANPKLLFPEAQSILCVALPYRNKLAGAPHLNQGVRYARYIQEGDYHAFIPQMLEKVMQNAHYKWLQNPANHPLKWKICVDTSAVLERSWANLAGLGWIGKNTLLIHPVHGSYLFLGEVLINQKTGQSPRPLPNFCGNCQRCLQSCPTQAFQEPHLLNSTRCISYWTLEKRGPLEITSKERTQIGPWVAGCDICQEVCPFNIKPAKREQAGEFSHISNQNHVPNSGNATTLKTWEELLLETSEEYKIRVKNSAMKRIKPSQFSRNLAISLSNHLSNQIRNNDLSNIQKLIPYIQHRVQIETDEFALREWNFCLKLIQDFDIIS